MTQKGKYMNWSSNVFFCYWKSSFQTATPNKSLCSPLLLHSSPCSRADFANKLATVRHLSIIVRRLSLSFTHKAIPRRVFVQQRIGFIATKCRRPTAYSHSPIFLALGGNCARAALEKRRRCNGCNHFRGGIKLSGNGSRLKKRNKLASCKSHLMLFF